MADETLQRVYQLIIDAGGSKAGADIFKQAAEQISAAAQKAAGSQEPLQRTTAQVEQAMQRLTLRMDPAARAQSAFAKDAALLQDAFQRQLIPLDQLQAKLQQLSQYHRVGQTGARSFGSAIQQAGYQVGDFAVQVASGGGVMRPLIQQGTQLISMFGPWGAVIGAAGAAVGALAPLLLNLSSATHDAAMSQAELNENLKEMDRLQKQIEGNTQRSRDSLQAELNYRLSLVQKQYDMMKAKFDAEPATIDGTDMFGNTTGGSEKNPLREEYRKQLIDLSAQLEAAKEKAGQFSDSFAHMGAGVASGAASSAKSIAEVTSEMEEQLRVLRLARQEREADKIVDQRLAELGLTRAGANQELLKSLTDLAQAQVAQTKANKDSEDAQRRSLENTKAVAAVLVGLKKQYDDLSKAPVSVRAENLFAGKIPTAEEMQRAEEWLKKIDAWKAASAADKQFRQEIDQIIADGTRGAEQRDKWERSSLQTQQTQIALLQKELDLGAANDNMRELAVAHLKAEQEVHAQVGNADANALKYVANADAIAQMNQMLQKQRAVARELPQFFDQAFDRIGSAITQAMATGEISMASLLDVGRAVVSELEQEFLKLALINPLKNWMNGDDALTTFGDLATMVGGWFTGGGGGGGEPARAGGGPTSAGNLYRVNENGREYFRPNVDGTVIPLGMSGASGTGGGQVVQIFDQRGSGTMDQEETTDTSGRQVLRIIFRDEVRTMVSTGALDRPMKGQFGINAQPKKRRS